MRRNGPTPCLMSRPRDGHRPWAAAFLLAAAILGGAIPDGKPLAGPYTTKGTQPPLGHPLLTPGNCKGCHGGYDTANNVEPWDTWAGSMMANAARDPIFWAALDVANNDVPNVGEFCLRCHASVGWLAGRSEAPGGNTNGCGLVGKIDQENNDFEGVACHMCHRMTTNPSPPAGQSSVYTENGQFWIDDSTCGGVGEPCRHGPYNYPADGTPPTHAWAYSSYMQSSTYCGNCHNVTSPVKTLIEGGTNTGIAYPIERTFREWQKSIYSDTLSTQFSTCQACHMADASVNPAHACVFKLNNHSGDMALHQFAGGNAWIPDVLRLEYPALNRTNPFLATKAWALDMLQNRSASLQITVPAGVDEGDTLSVQVKVTNLTGHKLPTGYPEGRRMWIEMIARGGGGGVIWRSGAYDSTTGVLSHDPQLKEYRAEPGIWNRNGTNQCDTDTLGSPAFHFVRNDCYAIDNRIPPLGFSGGSDPETKPRNYVYPETSPGSGVLVNYDITDYAIPIPPGTTGPVTVTATLRYQTSSKDYVQFLRDQAVTFNFPDDCIERTGGFPTKSRGEILYDMWTAHGRCAPVDMESGSGSATVRRVVGIEPGRTPAVLALAAENDPGGAGQIIRFSLPQESQVRLRVFDVSGRAVATLVDARRPAGEHVVRWGAPDAASGVYFYRLEAGSEVLTRKGLLIR